MVKYSKRGLLLLFEAIVLSLCISIVPVRYVLGIKNNNFILYGLLAVMSFLVVFGPSRLKMSVHKRMAFIVFMGLIVSILALITYPFSKTATAMDSIKFFVLLWVSTCVYSMPIEVIKKTILYILVINTLYSILVIIGFRSIDSFLVNGENYLTMTLSLSLALAILLSKMVCEMYFNKVSFKSMLLNLLGIAILFMGITRFSGRTAFFFPFITALIIPLFASKKHRSKLIKVYTFLIIISYIAYQLFMKYADPYTLSRMMRLVENISGEKRFEIWRTCLQMIYERKWFLVGGGINAFQDATGYYPHNIMLQFWSEYGIFGFSLFAGIVVSAIRYAIIRRKEFISYRIVENDIVFFWEVAGGCLYLFLTFMKSFSIYDGISLYIFIAMFFKCTNCSIGEFNSLKKAQNRQEDGEYATAFKYSYTDQESL